MVNLTSMDLNLLKVLDALLSEGSTVRAGARIGLSQPAVSAALARLRLTLGDELFLRQGQRLVPTDFASSLATPLREAMDKLELLLNGPEEFDPASADMVFRLSGSDFFADLLMPLLAGRIPGLAPGIRIQFIGPSDDEETGLLESGRADIALMPQFNVPDWIESAPALNSRMQVVARKDHPRLARAGILPGERIPVDLFCDLGHVIFTTKGSFSAMGDAALSRIGRKRRVMMTMPVFAGVYRAVAASDLIAMLPHQLVNRSTDELGLAVYQPPVEMKDVQLIMVWHRRSSSNPAHIWFRQIVSECLKGLN